jgi:hypothetical protein
LRKSICANTGSPLELRSMVIPAACAIINRCIFKIYTAKVQLKFNLYTRIFLYSFIIAKKTRE